MDTRFITITYFIYLPVVITLTWYVARTLFKNGKIFMLDIFHGNAEIASSTNKLFELGFYLLNVGFALLIMETNRMIFDQQDLLETLSKKLGGYSIYLGIMLFFNLMLFFRGKKAARKREVQLLLQQKQQQTTNWGGQNQTK